MVWNCWPKFTPSNSTLIKLKAKFSFADRPTINYYWSLCSKHLIHIVFQWESGTHPKRSFRRTNEFQEYAYTVQSLHRSSNFSVQLWTAVNIEMKNSFWSIIRLKLLPHCDISTHLCETNTCRRIPIAVFMRSVLVYFWNSFGSDETQ